MMTNQQLGQFKQTLLNRQNELISQVQDNFGIKFEMNQESIGELSNYDNHPGDMGSELFERGKDIALNEHVELELQDINEALHAIENGTYGICRECGEDIPLERLEAMPTANRCFEHADELEYHESYDRPVEEEVFSPNINADDISGGEEVGFDAEDTWQALSQYGTSETTSDFYSDHDNYDNMYPNSDEQIGSVTAEESFAAADEEGYFTGVTPNHRSYEEDFE